MVLRKKEYKNVFQQLEIYTYCSMNKQFVKEYKVDKNTCLMRKNKIAIVLWQSLRHVSIPPPHKKQKAKKVGNEFLDYQVTPPT